MALYILRPVFRLPLHRATIIVVLSWASIAHEIRNPVTAAKSEPLELKREMAARIIPTQNEPMLASH